MTLAKVNDKLTMWVEVAALPVGSVAVSDAAWYLVVHNGVVTHSRRGYNTTEFWSLQETTQYGYLAEEATITHIPS